MHFSTFPYTLLQQQIYNKQDLKKQMKIQLQTDILQKKLLFVNRAISTKSQLPILLHLLLETKENTLQISATDLEIGIQVSIPAVIEEEGSITVPAKMFSELIASLPVEKITLQVVNNQLEVTSKKTKTMFQTSKKDDFPKLFEEKGEEIATIKNSVLKESLSAVVFAASFDAVKPALTGVLISKELHDARQSFLLVATDGYRLSLKKTLSEDVIQKTNEQQDKLDKGILVPARVLREVLGIKDDDKQIVICISAKSNQILFYNDDTLLVGRLIEANFPNYEKIIPQDYETQGFFDREELQKAVKICSIFARETANIVKLSLKKDKIIVSANTPSVGENTVEVEARIKGEENEIAFNAKYLLDLCSNTDKNNMMIEMTGPLNPGVFKIENDESFLHIIMPIRVQG